MANEIERRYGAEGLHGLSIHPGGIVTAGYANMDPIVQPIFEPLFSTEAFQKVFKSLSQGAATQVLAAVGKDYEGEILYAYDLVRSFPADPVQARAACTWRTVVSAVRFPMTRWWALTVTDRGRSIRMARSVCGLTP